MSQSNSEKFNDCNNRDDSYCIFEKQLKETRDKIHELIREAELFPYDETDMKTVIVNLRGLLHD